MKVVYRPRADDDLRALYLYIHRESEAAAGNYLRRIISSIERLTAHPHSAPSRLGKYPDVRGAVAGNHIICTGLSRMVME